MNKRIITIIGMVIIAAGLAYFASAAGVVLFSVNEYRNISNGLVLDLNLNQNSYTTSTKIFADVSGNGTNGSSNNVAVFVPDNYGSSAGAMSFNGSNDYLDLGDYDDIPSLKFNGNNWAAFVWIKANSQSSEISLIGHRTGSDQDFRIGVTPDNKAYITWVSYPSHPAYSTTIGVKSLNDGVWHQVGAVRNGGTITLYVDGVVDGIDSTVGSYNITGSGWYSRWSIGALREGCCGTYAAGYWSRFFNGSISKVQVWNKSLSLAEVQTLFNSAKPKAVASSIQKGLVGHWPLDGDNYNATTGRVTDLTPYGNHGWNSSATLTTGRNNQSNGAMSFNGSNSYISMGDPASGLFDFGTGDFALSAWVKISALPSTWKSIIYKGGSGGPGYGMEISGSNYLTCSIQGISGNNQHYTVVGVIVGEWQHFVCVFDRDDKIYGYLNGTLIGSGSAYDAGNNTSVSTGNAFALGSFGPGQWYLSGSIAGVRAYNRALSASEVGSLYTQGGRSVGIVINPAVRDSCKEILDAGESHGDGVYTIKPNPTGYSFPVYCDMTTDGGGWTLINSHLVDSINTKSASVVTTYDSNGGVIVTSTATSPGCGAPPSSGSTIKIKNDIAWTQIRSIGEIYDNASCFSLNGYENYGGQIGHGNLITFNPAIDVMRNCYLTCEQLQFSNFTSRCDNDAGNFMRYNPGQWRRFETILRRNNPSVLSGIAAGVSCNGLTTKWRSSSIYVK